MGLYSTGKHHDGFELGLVLNSPVLLVAGLFNADVSSLPSSLSQSSTHFGLLCPRFSYSSLSPHSLHSRLHFFFHIGRIVASRSLDPLPVVILIVTIFIVSNSDHILTCEQKDPYDRRQDRTLTFKNVGPIFHIISFTASITVASENGRPDCKA